MTNRYQVSKQSSGKFVIIDTKTYEAITDIRGLTRTWKDGFEAKELADEINAEENR